MKVRAPMGRPHFIHAAIDQNAVVPFGVPSPVGPS